MRPEEVTLLLVEDDEVDQMAVKKAVKKLHITNELVVANNGLEALKALRQANGSAVQKPHLILLDLNMPRMNGIEFLKELRDDPNLRDSVVFVLTTSADQDDISRTYEKNIAGYILKSQFEDAFMKTVSMLNQYWQLVKLPS